MNKINSHLLNKNQKNNLMNIIEILNTVKNNNNSVFLYTPPIYANAISYILKDPNEIIICNDSRNTMNELKKVEDYTQQGLTGFALLNYELGYAFEKKISNYLTNEIGTNLFTILFFDEKNITKISSHQLNFTNAKNLLKEKKHSINNFHLATSKKKYTSDIEEIKTQIKIGNTYQVNYTVEGKFKFTGSIESLFLSTIFNQSAQFSAFINLEEKIIISNSPELFFKKKKDVISVKPMKGTIKRGINFDNDTKKCSKLLKSEKDLAENIMIVDLLRNDIGKVSKLNSVDVKSKFNLEKYESVYQLTSEVNGKLKDQSLINILRSTFPCGSITGAPKIKTMEIIKKLENRRRGLYTGSIGFFNKDEALFNVAIRTIQITPKDGNGEIGVGSGIVWDSKVNSEYEETKLKAKFLTNPDPYFEIIETILFENGSYFLLNEHLARLEQVSKYFLFIFDKKNILTELDKLRNNLSSSSNKSFKVKTSLDKWGKVAITAEVIQKKENNNLNIKISEKKINSKNKFQYFKTSNRLLYDEELATAKDEGFDEVIFLNEKDEITEGSISNIFIESNGKTFTPKISSGILNGIYREQIIKIKTVHEKKIALRDILDADKFYLVNSVRKEMNINGVWKENKRISVYN